MTADPNGQRAMVWISIVAALLYGFAYCVLMGFFPPPPADLPAAQVAQLYAAHNMQLRIGAVICLITGGFNVPLSVTVAIQMARVEKGIPQWAILQLIAGGLVTIPLMLPALFWGVAGFSAGRDPTITLLMHELAFLSFVTPVTYFILQAVPIAVVCFIGNPAENSAFPRWFGFMTAWVVIGTEVGVVAQLFKTGPFAWNGLFTFWIPIFLFSGWFATLCVTVLRAIDRQQRLTNAA